MRIYTYLFFIVFSFVFSQIASAQSEYHIAIVIDGSETDAGSFLEQVIEDEIKALVSAKRTPVFQRFYAKHDINKIKSSINKVFQDPKIDLVIGTGLNTCNTLALQKTYTKPTIITFLLDHELQDVPTTLDRTSGIRNCNYIESPFDIKRDFQTLYEVYPFKKIAILGENDFTDFGFNFDSFFSKQLKGLDAEETFVIYEENVDNVVANIPADADAVYMLPSFSQLGEKQLEDLLSKLADKKLPVFALLNEPAIKLGAFMAYESVGNMLKIPRRVALNVSKIIDGEKAEDLTVRMENFTDNLLINMKTARKIGLYPNWDFLAEATLVNVNEVDTDRKVSLRSAIVEGLSNNLDAQIAGKDVLISKKDVGIARSNYLPQIDIQSNGVLVDENSSKNSFGSQGRINWTAQASATQLILSEPALANITIQKLLYESQIKSKEQTELDVINNVTRSYLQILQAREIVRLRNQNIVVTRKNYDIAKTKQQIGYSGTTDVFRWESELALDNVDLNSAQANFNQAKFALNQLLNRPINEEFEIADVALTDSLLLVMDERILNLVENPGDLDNFASFLVSEGFSNLPELKQMHLAISAQERFLLSQKRAFYTPTVALAGEYNRILGRYDAPEVPPGFNAPADYSWNTAVSLQFPIFNGFNRKHSKEKAAVEVLKLNDQLQNTRNLLELQIRANLETAGASFSNLDLSQIAAEAARKNFEVAQDSYQQGLLNITALIDAQNAYFQAQINATNAVYQFVIDFMAVERSIGYYHFLAIDSERNDFFRRFIEFDEKQGK